jgi:hypothetical protein
MKKVSLEGEEISELLVHDEQDTRLIIGNVNTLEESLESMITQDR